MELINFLKECTCAGVPIDEKLVNIFQLIYKAIQIGVPIILIIVGMFDMGKAITQQKEDEIKKAQPLLVKKAIAAALVFLMFSIVSLVLGAVGYNDSENCLGCLLSDKESTYCKAKNGAVTEDKCAEGTTATASGNSCTCVKN